MAFKIIPVIFLLTILMTSNGQEQQEKAEKPHIVFLLVDDWGWANAGYHRNPPTKEVVTPNMDSLVKEGLELDLLTISLIVSLWETANPRQ